ncbi:type II toxin-antitoxin system RelE/ParE family toxin [bacterium]|nr:MAG: type II toxin-antitoxin system RelE/ParE family toxin [bacterium]
MVHKVVVSPLARQDILEAADYIQGNATLEQALQWKNGLITAVKTLTDMPLRCSIADESGEVGLEL